MTLRKFHRTGRKEYPMLGITFPASVGRALLAEGYTGCEFSITDNGFLLRPIKDLGAAADVAVLPAWDTEKEAAT